MRRLLSLALLASCTAFADDPRWCGVVYRHASGSHAGDVIRSKAEVAKFKREWPCVYPCDVTWRVDHIIPAGKGGCDISLNMQWLPPSIKSCAVVVGGAFCKDRWELRVYGQRPFVTVYK